jgi:hypothetical protein
MCQSVIRWGRIALTNPLLETDLREQSNTIRDYHYTDTGPAHRGLSAVAAL